MTAPKHETGISRLAAVAEFGIVAAIFIVDRPDLHVIVFSKTLYLAVLAAVSLYLRGAWKQLGLGFGPNFGRVIVIGLAGGVAMEALELFVTQPLLDRLYGNPADLSDFGGIKGNWSALGEFLVLTWTLGAVGEEFVYRGYLLNRLEGLLTAVGRPPMVAAFSLVISSVVFGYAHLYQGATGITENVIDGLILGSLYLASGRRLWVPIIAHGVQDSTDFLLIFSGHYPA